MSDVACTVSQCIRPSCDVNFITISLVVELSASANFKVSRYLSSPPYSWRWMHRDGAERGIKIMPLVADDRTPSTAFARSSRKNRLFHGAKCRVSDLTTIFLDTIQSASAKLSISLLVLAPPSSTLSLLEVARMVERRLSPVGELFSLEVTAHSLYPEYFDEYIAVFSPSH
jgi:hypothetical protein